MATLFDFGRKLITKSKDFGKSLVPPKQPYMANKKQRENIKLAREAAFDKQIKTGAAVTTATGTAAYMMSGDATLTPKAKPSAPSSSPARTPVADAPKKEFINWRDRPSRADASKPFESKSSSSPTSSRKSGISTGATSKALRTKLPGSNKKTMSRKGGGPSIPFVRSSDVRGRFRRDVKSNPTATQETQSIAKPAETSKRYELSPKQAGDKLLQTASNLFPKKDPPAYKNPNAFTKRDLVGTDGMSAGEITKRFNTEGYKTPAEPELVRRPGETETSFIMRKERAKAAQRRAELKNK